MRSLLCLSLVLLSAPVVLAQENGESESFPVNITVKSQETLGEVNPIWRFFGADEPNYATMPHGRTLLKHLGELAPKQVYFRAHNLLCTGDGTPALKWGSTNAYTEDEQGNPVYDWEIVDEIFDAYLENGVRPYVEIGFMPKALSTNPEPYQHSWTPRARYEEIYTGWAHPPTDYEKWAELVYNWVKHCVERYGKEEVEQWYWQTWNEPNIPYWQGTREEFFKLNDYTIDAVLRALPTARVGGPDVAGHGGDFTRAFFEHCLRGMNHATGETGSQLDFVSFHAKGRPRYVDDRVQMGIAAQLRTIDEGFEMIASYPELKDKPIVIGESDPEGCAACQGPQLGYRNGTMYSSYTAASFVRKMDLARKHGVNLRGALTWAFEFEGHPLFAGFRSMASGGIDKPVLNTFRMFEMMEGDRVAVESDHEVPLRRITRRGVRRDADVAGYASRDEGVQYVMVWHYHDDDLEAPAAAVNLQVEGLPTEVAEAKLTHYRIDQEHSNSYTAWQRMGSPQEPTDEQYQQLLEAAKLTTLGDPEQVELSDGNCQLEFTLPRKAVSLLVIDWR